MNATKKILAAAITALSLGAAMAPTAASAHGWGGFHHHHHHGWWGPHFGYYGPGYGGCYRKWIFVPGIGTVVKTFCY